MKKLIFGFILFSIAGIFVGCSSPETKPMAGGIYTAEYDARGESALKFALADMNLSSSNYRVSLYKKQVVNGTNHFFIVKVEDTIYEIKVYEDLSGTFKLESHKEVD